MYRDDVNASAGRDSGVILLSTGVRRHVLGIQTHWFASRTQGFMVQRTSRKTKRALSEKKTQTCKPQDPCPEAPPPGFGLPKSRDYISPSFPWSRIPPRLKDNRKLTQKAVSCADTSFSTEAFPRVQPKTLPDCRVCVRTGAQTQADLAKALPMSSPDRNIFGSDAAAPH